MAEEESMKSVSNEKRHYYFLYWHQRSGENPFENADDTVLYSLEKSGINGLTSFISQLSSKLDDVEASTVSLELVMSNFTVEDDLETIHTVMQRRLHSNKRSGSCNVQLGTSRLDVYYTSMRPKGVVEGEFVLMLSALSDTNKAETDDDFLVFQSEYSDFFWEMEEPLNDYYNSFLARDEEGSAYPERGWKEWCMLFGMKVVSLLKGDSLEWMLFTGLSGKSLTVYTEDNGICESIIRFHKLLQFIGVEESDERASLEGNGSLSSENQELASDFIIDVKISEGESEVSVTCTPTISANKFIIEFAEELKECNNPFQMRQIVDFRKTVVIKDLNETKRLVAGAIKDNYRLYQAFIFLRENGNWNILLPLLNLVDTASTMKITIELLRRKLAQDVI